jgi:ABC-2 type transport system ATP-binding protein
LVGTSEFNGRWAIETEGLRKSFKDVQALCGIDLRVEAGTVLGLLGPNGAGKTTAVRILTTLLPPSGGSARVTGLDIVRDAAALRAQIGLAGQYAAVDQNLTGFENLEMVGRLYHLGRGPARERAAELLERFELAEAAERLVKTYSGGMRRRLDLAAALVARPPVLFLDEPTTGLDPRSRIGLWEVIEARVAAGTTVLLTTQYLDEADRLADRIAVIDHGNLIDEGSSDELKRRVGGERIELRLERPEQCEPAIAALADLASEAPSAEDGTIRVPVRERRGAIAAAVRRLDAEGIAVDDILVTRPTLDDVFMTLTGRPPEPGDGEADDAEAVEQETEAAQ